MQYNQSISHAFDNLHRTDDPYDQPGASSKWFPSFLTTSVVLFAAIDATMYLFRWGSRREALTTSPLRPFVIKAEEILQDFVELEMEMEMELKVQQRRIKRRVGVPPSESRCSSRVRRRVISQEGEKHERGGLSTDGGRKGYYTSIAFDSFCERLLLMNRIWKQEREMKQLRASLESKRTTTATTAFETFCDQLLLWNRIWKLEKAVKWVIGEGEKMRRSRGMAITRAAKRMVVDVQKERLVEEFVKELIEEVEEEKREMKVLREVHEMEMREMNGDWLRDYRVVVRELDGLKLAQESRLVEQEMANEEEDSLYRNLVAGKRRVEELEMKLLEYEEDGSSSDETVVGGSTSRTTTTKHDEDELDDLCESWSTNTRKRTRWGHGLRGDDASNNEFGSAKRAPWR